MVSSDDKKAVGGGGGGISPRLELLLVLLPTAEYPVLVCASFHCFSMSKNACKSSVISLRRLDVSKDEDISPEIAPRLREVGR